MAIPPIFVKTAREIWNCEWNILMNELAPADSKGNYKRPENIQQEICIPTKENLEQRTNKIDSVLSSYSVYLQNK